MPPQPDWRRYAAPAAFLLAVTVAVVLVRQGLERGSSGRTTTSSVTTAGRTTTGATTAPATTGKRAARRYWTVKAGDTFGVISTKTGVPVATIEKLNPKASSTSLFIGEKIRLE